MSLFKRQPANPSPLADPPKIDPPVVDPPVVSAPVDETKAELDQVKATLFQMQENMTNFFLKQNQPSATHQPPAAPQIEDVSDDDYEKALMGDIADRKQAARIVQTRHTAIAKREKLELQQQINDIQATGISAISGLTRRDLDSLPYYQDFKKEIDTAISNLPPAERINSSTLKGVYDYVVGHHVDEIIEKKKEEILRQAAAAPAATPTPGRSSNATITEGVPAPEEALPKDALDAIKFKFGRLDVDGYARTQGCKDWADYYTKYLKPLEGNA